MAKKKCFSKDQHKKTGSILKKIRQQLLELLANEIQHSYPKSSNAYRFTERAWESIERLRCELDDLFAKETTEDEWQAESLQNIYYGPECPRNG